MKRIITISILSVAIAVIATFGIFKQTQQVKAQAEEPPPNHDRVSFGMVGITSGQTVRVSVANTIMPNDSEFPPGPTRVVMSFRGMNGQLIRNRNGDVIRRVVDLERGDAAFLDLNYDDFPPGPSRLQLRSVIVAYPPGPSVGDSPPPIGDRIAAAVDIINNANGRTAYVMYTSPAVARGFNPQPDPPLGE